jgi:predicted membrane protein
MIFFYVWYPLLIIASIFIFHNILLNLAFIISLPLTGIFSFYYYKHLLKLRGKFRLIRLKFRDRKAYEELLRQRKKIVLMIEEMLKA